MTRDESPPPHHQGLGDFVHHLPPGLLSSHMKDTRKDIWWRTVTCTKNLFDSKAVLERVVDSKAVPGVRVVVSKAVFEEEVVGNKAALEEGVVESKAVLKEGVVESKAVLEEGVIEAKAVLRKEVVDRNYTDEKMMDNFGRQNENYNEINVGTK